MNKNLLVSLDRYMNQQEDICYKVYLNPQLGKSIDSTIANHLDIDLFSFFDSFDGIGASYLPNYIHKDLLERMND